MTASTNGTHANALPVSIDEIQYSHDILSAVLENDLPLTDEELDEALQLDDQTKIEMAASLNVLCWLLGHDNQTFIENMRGLEEALDNAGIVFDQPLDN